MSHSDPELRVQLADAIEAEGTVKAESIADLKQKLGMSGVSNTQFGRALRSLHYNPGPVHVNRPHVPEAYLERRPYHVTFVPEGVTVAATA